MLIKGLYLILPAMALAAIEINIDVKERGRNTVVGYRGSAVNVINDVDRRSFGIASDNLLKDAVGKAYGGRPDDVYVKSPTPWGDLYQSYNWPQIQVTLTPVDAKVLRLRSEPTIVATRTYRNNSTNIDATYNTGIEQKVSQTISNTWTSDVQLSIGQSISYKVDFVAGEVEGKTSFSFSTAYGQSKTVSETVTVGSKDGIEVVLKPGQSATSSLMVTKGNMDVEVTYEATLSGYIACNYASGFEGHHFWASDINYSMESIGLPTVKTVKEIIKIGFFSDGQTVLGF